VLEDTCTTLLLCRSSGTFDEALPVPLLTRTWYWWPLVGTLTVAFPVEHLTVTDCGAAAKEMSALPWLVVTCTAGERSAVAVTLPEPVLTCSGPDTPLMFTPPWLPLTVTGADRPETVSVFDPELTVTAIPGGTATWNLEPQLNTSPEQSMPSCRVSPLSVHDEWPGLAAVPLSHRCTSMPGPFPGTSCRSEEESSMVRLVPLRLNARWSWEELVELEQAARASDAAVAARASVGIGCGLTLIEATTRLPERHYA